MNNLKYINLAFLLIFSPVVSAQHTQDLPLKTSRITDKVVLVSATTGNSAMVGINSSMGLVVIDAMWSPAIAERSRKIIENEFGKSNLRYYIISNPGILSIGGNTVFKDAVSIAHSDCKEEMKRLSKELEEYLDDRASEFQERVDRTEIQMKELDSDSEEYKSSKRWLDLCKQIRSDFTKGFKLKFPEITFSDKLILDLGDLTIELIYIGNAGNVGELIVFIPEEGFVFTGDLFHYHHVLPLYYNLKPDISRWIEVKNYLYQYKNSIKYVARSNGKRCWNMNDLESRFILLNDIIKEVEEADNNNLQLTEFLSQLSEVDIKFPYIKDWDVNQEIGNSIIRSDVKRIAISLWNENHKSAFEEIKFQYEEAGIEEAIRKFNQLKDFEGNEYYFTENQINNYGYTLMNSDKVSDAIEFFKINVVMHPTSANVYDSLGEAYKKNGQTKLAIKNYEKSIVLNPENENAKDMINKLKE